MISLNKGISWHSHINNKDLVSSLQQIKTIEFSVLFTNIDVNIDFYESNIFTKDKEQQL
jgi:hypothetical protein